MTIGSNQGNQPRRRSRRFLSGTAILGISLLGMIASVVAAPVARANGVALAAGDVLAATGNGLVKHFDSSGNLLDTLDTGTGTTYTTGMCFSNSNDLLVTDFGANELSQFDSGGNLLTSTWATEPALPESCTVDASGNVYVGGPGGATIYKYDAVGALITSFSVTGGSGTGGTDWVDLASDQCTLLYTGEGSEILSYNVCTQTQNPDFATGLPGPCYELRIRPNGDVIVACETEAVRLDSSGSVVQTYPVTGSSVLFAMNLDPDNTTFWTGDIGNGEISHVDIATGNVLSQFASSPSTSLAGLVIVGGSVVSQPSITLTPSTATHSVGTTDTTTATITNPGGSISGQTINFSVSGANTASGTGTTDASGHATFTYTGTNAGNDTVTGTFTNSHGATATGTASVTWTGSTTPTCALSSVSNGPPSQLQLTAQDTGSGMKKVAEPWHQNATVQVSPFTKGTTNPVTLTFTKQVETVGGSASVTATNVAGAKAYCVAFFKTVAPSRAYSQGFHFRASRNMLVIQNGAGALGLTSVGIVVDGTTIHATLTPGEQYQLSLTGLIHSSPPSNTVVVEGHGPAGSSAVAVVWGSGLPA